jgi:hypothetical protein
LSTFVKPPQSVVDGCIMRKPKTYSAAVLVSSRHRDSYLRHGAARRLAAFQQQSEARLLLVARPSEFRI